MSNPISIQGSTLEGGGQVIRLSVALSALTGIPIHIYDIRAKRAGGGGLGEQHLTSVKWLAAACGAKLTGATLGSRTLVFEPGKNRSTQAPKHTTTNSIPHNITIDLGNPGPLTLVLQALLPFLLFTPTSTTTPYNLTLHGGTNIINAPSIDYTTQVLLPNLALLGLPLVRISPSAPFHRGWAFGGSRTGFGRATFEITPLPAGTSLPAFQIPRRHSPEQEAKTETQTQTGEEEEQQTPLTITATLLASPPSTRHHLRQSLTHAITRRHHHHHRKKWRHTTTLHIALDAESGHPKRTYLLLVAKLPSGMRVGRDCLYEGKIGRGEGDVQRAMEEVAEGVLRALEEEVCGAQGVDGWMEDQVVVFQALARGRSGGGGGCGVVEEEDVGVDSAGAGGRSSASLHTLGARWLVGEILGVGFDGEGGCEGVGFVAGEAYVKRDTSGG